MALLLLHSFFWWSILGPHVAAFWASFWLHLNHMLASILAPMLVPFLFWTPCWLHSVSMFAPFSSGVPPWLHFPCTSILNPKARTPVNPPPSNPLDPRLYPWKRVGVGFLSPHYPRKKNGFLYIDIRNPTQPPKKYKHP